MGEPTGPIIVICGLDTDGKIRALEVTVSDELKVALATATGSDLLTELEAKLETDDLELDAQGALDVIFKSQDTDVEVKQQAPADMLVGTHGLIGGSWQKNPIMLGYSDVVIRSANDNSIAAIHTNLDDSAVPTGEIWVITNAVIRYNGTVPGHLRFQVVQSATPYNIFSQAAPVSGQWYDRQFYFIMDEGMNLRCRIESGTIGDSIHLQALGFKIDVDQ